MSEPDPGQTPSENLPSPNEPIATEGASPAIAESSATNSTLQESPQASSGSGTSFVRFLYNHNPFYLLSACLFVYGLKSIFRVGNSAMLFDAGTVGYMEPWGLMLSLAAVTLLMSLTAIVIVRFGGVWEDARSIVMVVLLMFFAISVSFDELLTVKSDRDTGGTLLSVMLLMAASLFFSVGVSETLIRGLLVQLRRTWRMPLYLFLVLFFGYPILLLPEMMPWSTTKIQWLIGFFPTVAGLIALTLIPAIRQGSGSVANNGTPWSWPMFPWSPFVMIACAVIFRSYSLTISFDAPGLTTHFWDSAFGVYLLVPFLLAVLVLLLEISIVEKLPRLQNGVLACSPILLLMAHPRIVPWHRLPSYAAFLDQLTYSIASPVYLTLFGLLLFFTRALWQGVKAAEFGWIVSLLGLAIVPTRVFVDANTSLSLRDGQIWPMLILGLVYARKFWRHRTSGSVAIVVIAAMLMLRFLLSRSGLGGWNNFVSLNIALIAVIWVGRALRDDLAEILRELGPPMLTFSTVSGSLMLLGREMPMIVAVAYVLLMTAAAFVFAKIWRSSFWLSIFSLHCIVLTGGSFVAATYMFVAMKLPDGVKTVILAGFSFLMALTVSGLKAGMATSLRRWLDSFKSIAQD